MNKFPALILSTVAFSFSGAALAGSDSGFYIGGSLGSAEVDYSDNLPDFGDISFDDTDTGYKVFAGYNFGWVPLVNLAIEGAYVDFGSHDGEIAEVTGNKIESNGWTAFGLAGVDLGPIGLFAKAGMFLWDSDVKSEFGDTSDSGTDPAYGIGAKIQLGSIAVRAEWELFELDRVDIDYFSVGASYTF